MPATPTTWNLRHVCILLFALSFFVIAMHPEARLMGKEVPYSGEAVRVARSLVDHGTFANPFRMLDTGETAHVAPVYPFIYAALLKMFGTGYPCLLIIWGINIAFLAVQLALLPWLTSRLGFGMTPGIIASALGAISVHTGVDGSWECFLVGFFLMLICFLTWRIENWSTLRRALLLGLVWGVLVLTNPIMVFLLLAWPAVIVASLPAENRKAMFVRALVMICTAMLIVSTWIIRDYAQFGAFMFVRDNLGLELSIGNNPCAAATFRETEKAGCLYLNHPNGNPVVAKSVADMGELAFERARLHRALNWMNENREAFLKLTAQRFRQFWFPTVNDRHWEQYLVWLITLMAAPGMILLWRKNAAFARLVLLSWILFPLIYYLVPSETRYRYPIYWTMLLPAGCALAAAYAKLSAAQFVPAIFRQSYRPAIQQHEIK